MERNLPMVTKDSLSTEKRPEPSGGCSPDREGTPSTSSFNATHECRISSRVAFGPVLAAAIPVYYAFSWVCSQAYFTSVGAAWVVPILPTTAVVVYGILPSGCLAFLIYSYCADWIFGLDNPRKRTSFHPNWKTLIAALVVYWALETLPHISSVTRPIATFLSLMVSGFLCTQFAAILAARICGDLAMPERRFALVGVGFVLSVFSFGDDFSRVRAFWELRGNHSRLPIVVVASEESDEHRLLCATSEYLFLVPLRWDTPAPPIRIVDPLGVEYLQARD